MEARRRLRDAAANGTELPAGELYDLVLLSTGDQSQAEAAAKARIAAQLRAGQRPDPV
jgi:hypothetical protein